MKHRYETCFPHPTRPTSQQTSLHSTSTPLPLHFHSTSTPLPLRPRYTGDTLQWPPVYTGLHRRGQRSGRLGFRRRGGGSVCLEGAGLHWSVPPFIGAYHPSLERTATSATPLTVTQHSLTTVNVSAGVDIETQTRPTRLRPQRGGAVTQSRR